jgi:hypothetical protein
MPDAADAGPAERREVLALALAARDQHQRTVQAVDRGDGRADVRALGIVDEGDAAPVAHALGPVRKAAEAAQDPRHRRLRKAADAAQGERRERVRGVVAARQPELRAPDDRLAARGEPVLAAARQQPEVGVVALEAERDAALAGTRHAHHDSVVEVHHGRGRTLEDARLRGRVIREAGVTVEVVRRHVQHRGRLELEGIRRLQLVRGQLEHVHGGGRPREQVERGLAEVAADAHRDARRPGELADQRRDGALAVGAGDADDAATRLAREQLDVADQVEPLRGGPAQEGLGQRDTRRYHDLVRTLEHGRVEAAERGRRLRHQAAQLRKAGRI